MKKAVLSALSLFLVLLLLFSATPLAFAENASGLKVTVASDIHYQCFADTGALSEVSREDKLMKGLQDKDTYYYASQQGQMNFESSAITKSMLEAFAASDSDTLLIAGDLTCGGRQSHMEFAGLLKNIADRTGKHIYVTVGNHDTYAEATEQHISIDEFKTVYADFGFNQAIAKDADSACYALDLDNNFRLIAIDSCIYGKDDGEVNDAKREWIFAQVDAAKQAGKTPIAMMHHSLLPHFAVQPMIDGYMDLATQLANKGVHYVLTGHIHANDISSAQTKAGNMIYDIQTGSLITYPCPYRFITLSAKGLDITTQYVTKINLSDLPEGYTESQLQKMQADFPAYAKGFFEAGMCRYINRYIGSAGKLGKTLKLDTDSAAYKVLDALLLKVGDALALPIYDDGATPGVADSVEEIANNAGYTLPASNYTRIYQLVATVMSGFFQGDEAASVKTTEVPLLLACVKACLAHAIANMVAGQSNADDINALIKQITGTTVPDKITGSLAKMNFAESAASKIADALLAPLLEGLSCDMSAPADLNLTISAQSAESNTLPLTTLQKIVVFLRKFFSALFTSLRFPVLLFK